MRLIRKLLYPFSLLYAGIMYIRNKMYDRGIFDSQAYEFPLICVGNLSAGGTGKTPMIEYLVSLLKRDFRLATLSRGYRRESRGFFLLKGSETAKQVGDEPLQFKSKFPELRVAVDEKRQHGIEELRKLEPRPEVILLDDAFQHRKVKAGLNILLTSYGDLYSEDQVLPTGNLRESKAGAKRAQLIVVTKCPLNLEPREKALIREKLMPGEEQQLFFAGIAYGKEILNGTSSRELESLKGERFTLVSGIANPAPLVAYLKSLGLSFEHLTFPDHHNFTEAELQKIAALPFVLTTEKDFMRLKGSLKRERLFYLPMQMTFLSPEESSDFDRAVFNYIKKKMRPWKSLIFVLANSNYRLL